MGQRMLSSRGFQRRKVSRPIRKTEHPDFSLNIARSLNPKKKRKSKSWEGEEKSRDSVGGAAETVERPEISRGKLLGLTKRG